ncbi:MAG: fused MFS/spermidine synthase [Candidatus Velthaea sp.]
MARYVLFCEATVSSLALRLRVRALPERLIYAIIFSCFFISGFASLLYEVLWTRLAFAHFGIITPLLSIIVSVFMMGLGVGSAYGGRLAASAEQRFNLSPLYLYAAAETIVAVGAFSVPSMFDWCAALLLRTGVASSTQFLVLSGACIVVALLPWCIAMGSTIPLMMAFARKTDLYAGKSFSFLYAANVLGAAAGAAITALVLIELFGLRVTTTLGAIGNLTIAAIAVALAMAIPSVTSEKQSTTRRIAASARARTPSWVGPVLFITGLCSVGLEVCWSRDFTFELQTTIYAFAAILATYLIATFFGSAVYRIVISRNAAFPIESCVPWLFPLSLLPVLLTDPRVDRSVPQTLLGIVPLCALLGFLTPGLIDRFASGDATRAGRFYALNITGGIVGPLAAGYWLLPLFGIRWSMIVMAMPFLAASGLTFGGAARGRYAFLAGAALLAVTIFFSRAYDDGSIYPAPTEVHRDYATSVVAYGAGMSAQLLVNAIPITVRTTDTKVMAHLPMALLKQPRSALDICFGMGTTFRSLSTWGLDTTAVDLSPSVIRSFSFFRQDAGTILANARNHIVADDGRRFLMRTSQRYDLITLDPPPPPEAAGSSLLYSVQFYEIAKLRLAPGGILAQWLPHAERRLSQSVALALARSFPYVRVFRARYGVHFIASMTPFVLPSAKELVRRMPPSARRDLAEWANGETAQAVMQRVLNGRVTLDAVLPPPGSSIPALSDDRPYNEYFFLRRAGLIE